jgi:hypothetical protein
MDSLPPAIGARLFQRGELLSDEQRTAPTSASRAANFSANPGASERAPTFTSAAQRVSAAAATPQGARSLAAWDTPVDPLQLVWLHGREREDFEGF